MRPPFIAKQPQISGHRAAYRPRTSDHTWFGFSRQSHNLFRVAWDFGELSRAASRPCAVDLLKPARQQCRQGTRAMVDLKDLRENPDKYRDAARKKRITVDIDALLELENQRRALDARRQQ